MSPLSVQQAERFLASRNKMINQEEYWDKKISGWTRASYKKETGKTDLIERIANLFRGPITKRMEVALKVIGPRAKGKTVADLGCGLGDFCFAVLKYNPKKIIGVDISGVAVREAQKMAQQRGLKNRIEFIQADTAKMKKLPNFDIAVGLGFIDYLNKQEMKELFKAISGRYFLFSVFEKKLSWRNLLHAVYIKIQECPGAYKYSRSELLDIVPANLNPFFLEKDKMLFITNLPK